MCAQTSPQLPAVGEMNSKPTYASFTTSQPQAQSMTKTQLKQIEFNHGEPVIKFTMEEVRQYTIEEGLHQALVLKFSYGQPEMPQIRKLIPKSLGTKGQCLIGWLARRHILIRFDRYEDYVIATSRVVNTLHCDGQDYMFRIFPWCIGFNAKEESSRAFTWISLPNLPPELFAKSSLLSIASAVGKPIAIDKATQERSRPSTAKVKVELDLLDKHPDHIRIQYMDEKTGKVLEHIQNFVFDNLPLFCSYCKHQGHEEMSCRLMVSKKCNDTDLEQYQGDARELLNIKRQIGDAERNDELINQQGSVSYKKSNEVEIGIADTENNRKAGDQLIAGLAITDPKKSVAIVHALIDNTAMKLTDQTNAMAGQQLSSGVSIGTLDDTEQQGDAYGLTTNSDVRAAITAQTDTRKKQNTNKQNRNKGKEVMVYVEKRKPSGIITKPAGIVIHDVSKMTRAGDITEATMPGKQSGKVQSLQQNPKVNANTTANGNGTDGVNRTQQKTTDHASTPATRNSNDHGNEWNVVTRKKSGRFTTNANKEVQTIEIVTEPTAQQEHTTDAVKTTEHPQQQGKSQTECDNTKPGDKFDGQQILMALDQNTISDTESTGHTETDENGNPAIHSDNKDPGQQGNDILATTEQVDSDGHSRTIGQPSVGNTNHGAAAEEMQKKMSRIVESSKDEDVADMDTQEFSEPTTVTISLNEKFETLHRDQPVDIHMMSNVVTGGQHHNSSNWAVLVEEEENPNATDYTPHETEDQNEEKELLEALVHVNPLEMENFATMYFPTYYRESADFNSDREDSLWDIFYQKSDLKPGIPPWKQRSRDATNANKSHVANPKGEDEETVPRKLRMRQTKQKGVGPSTSTRSKKSKKKQ